MRVFIAVLVLIFSFQSWTKANEFGEFEIEGMLLKESLLKYFDKDEIEAKKKRGFVYPKKDFYSATFVANDKWEIVDLPFSKFKHRFSNKPLDGNDIRTFGIVAYGRDFFSDVSVSEIIFYY